MTQEEGGSTISWDDALKWIMELGRWDDEAYWCDECRWRDDEMWAEQSGGSADWTEQTGGTTTWTTIAAGDRTV